MGAEEWLGEVERKLRVSPVLWADGCSSGPLRVYVWFLDVYGQMGLSL